MSTMSMSKQDWLDQRVIGSSDAPAIMGVSKWTTPYKLWENKVLGRQIPDNPNMEHGRRMEPVARRWFEKKTGVKVPAASVVHGNWNWMTANLDGLSDSRDTAVEIKCPKNPKDHLYVRETGLIPEHYYPQVQHQLECVPSIERMFYLSYFEGEGLLVEIDRNESYARKLISKEEEFYRCWLNLQAPPMVDKDYRDRSGEESWLSTRDELVHWKGMREWAEKQEEHWRARAIELAERENSQGGGMRVTKSLVQGSVDYKSVPELKGIDLNKYRKKPYEKWTITTK